jgi:hypothetical protein
MRQDALLLSSLGESIAGLQAMSESSPDIMRNQKGETAARRARQKSNPNFSNSVSAESRG